MPSAASILILSFSRLESDARLLKQIASLLPGHEVTTCGYGPAPTGVTDHVQLPDDAVYWRYDRASVVAHRYRSAYWSNPAVSAASTALAGRRFDIVFANDIDTAGLALSLEPRLGVHLDLHEYSPLQNSELLRFRLFMAPFLSWQCRTFATKVTSTTTVCQSLAEKYTATFGFKPEVVTNAAPFAALEPTAVGAPIRIVHAGAALANRQLETLIDGVEGLEATVSLDLYLTPNDLALMNRLRERSAALPHVQVHDAVPYAELMQTLNGYDLGVHLLAPTNFNNTYALPNKFFDYVQARLGLVIGPSPEMVRLLDEHSLGVVTDDFSSESLHRTLAALTPDDVAGWKSASHAAASDLSAETQVRVWTEAVARIEAG